MSKESDHQIGVESGLHDPRDNQTEGGACLTGHATGFRPWSCSYRWQAVIESRRSRKAIYDKEPQLHPDHVKAGAIRTSAYVSERGHMTPLHHAFKLALPKPGDWHLSGPFRPDAKAGNGKRISPGKNFTKDTWPYWNNAHHLIPKALFLETIEDPNVVPDPDCQSLIQQSLLRAKYNINHHVNVILLPNDKEPARALKLPRHLVLEDGPDGLDDHPKFNHDAYNRNVLDGLKSVINAYKAACERATEHACETSELTLSKRLLEDLSRQCLEAVLEFGSSHPGEAISSMSQASFS
jgi:hypothetical protein